MISVRMGLVVAGMLVASVTSAAEITNLEQTQFLKLNGDNGINLVRLTINTDTAISPATITIEMPQHDLITSQTDIAAGDSTVEMTVPTVSVPTTATVYLTPSISSAPPLTRDFLLQPVKRWKIYAVPSTHLDIGYTANRKAITDLHNDNFDHALQLMEDNPAVTWNVEVAWEVQNYLQERPPTSGTALLQAMREDKIGLHAAYLNMLTALMSDEAMNRLCLYAAHLGREHDIHTSTAILSDVPTATWALPSVLASSGIKYFSEGGNPDRGPMLPKSNRDNPFYWQGPDGKKVLTFLSRHYALAALWLAESPDLAQFQTGVASVVAPFRRPDYPSDAVYLYGAFLDNRPFNSNYGRFLADYKAKWDFPEVIIATSDEFFEYLEKNSGSQLETVKGDFGAFWEDGAGSTAQATTVHMSNQRRAAAVETLYSLAHLANPGLTYPADQLEQVWEDILFYAEHTWGAAESISHPDSPPAIEQWTEKSEFSSRPRQVLDELTTKVLAEFAPSAPDRLAVINPLNFNRGGYIPLPECPPGTSLQLTGPAGEALPVQDLNGTPHAWVSDAPGLTQHTYTISTAPATTPAAPEPDSTTLENEHYRIIAQNGEGIASITDLESGLELIDADSPYGFGQIVYALGGEDTSMVHSASGNPPVFVHQPPLSGTHTATTPPLHQVHVYPAGDITIRPGENGPLHSEVIVSSIAPSMPQVNTTVRLHHMEKRISVDVRITSKIEERRKEGVYIAFPFAAEKEPEFRLGMTNSISNPAKDFLSSGCHEWYCVQDFVTCADPDGGEVLWSAPDAPLITLSELNRGSWKQHPELTTPTIFSYAMNNYWHTNYKAGQGGDFLFRYNLTSSPDKFSNVESLQFARACANPLLTAPSAGTANAAAVGETSPSLTVAGDGLIVNTVRRATNGDPGYILRLRNPGAEQVEATITRNDGPGSFKIVDLVENDLIPPAPVTTGPAKIPVPPFQTVTVYME